ncbi:hypothetical protein J6358_14980 [Burkholderia pseudomallei]|uniref:hypothetical protein n=1 Tax=Burkholderia pseudomallei TaxID=28450 RepID=UPI00193DA504|nr:hypothetical protein [Burkholderia pseudomallei]MBO7752797.1 hypothetical protein [Burkholderia pseudomallei]MBO7804366.1 hypothetical protein [Burkholderia pseudomallei]MBO7931042.1 hypothetical protein [Burkholderia pseudomallei]QRM22866.1 hypothetical protein JQX71_00510 [Burkholderia pseudomallei]
MARLTIILLYFVLPVLVFAAFVLYQVGVQHFGVAMMLAGAVVFLAWAALGRTPRDRQQSREADEQHLKDADASWNAYYASHQNESRHH